ncbi:MAG: lysoplasmalogenase [Phenylobacterium sp.]|nr:lysoplasmalogenase [Phenylobacterium sp.]
MDRREAAALLVLAAAVVGGISYIGSWDLGLPEAASLAWKGSGVGLLALYAALRARTADGWLIAAVMAAGAAGDVLLGPAGPVGGGLAFLLGHLAAIWLYLRNRRSETTLSQRLLAILLAPATVATAVLLVPHAAKTGVGVYALGLSLMAATAWVSRFPRRLTGIGALMFLASDLLIFARMGPLAGAAWLGLAIWSLYFAGQVLIVLGVTRTLARAPADRPS